MDSTHGQTSTGKDDLRKVAEALPFIAVVAGTLYGFGYYAQSVALHQLGVGAFQPSREAIFGSALAALIYGSPFFILTLWYRGQTRRIMDEGTLSQKVTWGSFFVLAIILVRMLTNEVLRTPTEFDSLLEPLALPHPRIGFWLLLIMCFFTIVATLRRSFLPWFPSISFNFILALWMGVSFFMVAPKVSALKSEFGGFQMKPVELTLVDDRVRHAILIVSNEESIIVLERDYRGRLGSLNERYSVTRIRWDTVESIVGK